jgi:hypothetical protein
MRPKREEENPPILPVMALKRTCCEHCCSRILWPQSIFLLPATKTAASTLGEMLPTGLRWKNHKIPNHSRTSGCKLSLPTSGNWITNSVPASTFVARMQRDSCRSWDNDVRLGSRRKKPSLMTSSSLSSTSLSVTWMFHLNLLVTRLQEEGRRQRHQLFELSSGSGKNLSSPVLRTNVCSCADYHTRRINKKVFVLVVFFKITTRWKE